MEDVERWLATARQWIDIAVQWIDANLQTLRSLSPDRLLTLGAICALVAFLFLCAWLYAIRRNRVLKRQMRSLKEELAVVQKKYDSEVAWRMAADNVLGKQPARAVQPGDQVT